MTYFKRLLVPVVLASALMAGCDFGGRNDTPGASQPAGTSAIELSLTPVSVTSDHATVALRLDTDGGAASKARVMELMLDIDGPMTFAGYKTGDALERVGKTLVVQKRGDNGLRLVAYSGDSLQTLQPGVLAVLEFDRASVQPATIDFDTGRQVFAPMEANTGLHVGKPLTVGAR